MLNTISTAATYPMKVSSLYTLGVSIGVLAVVLGISVVFWLYNYKEVKLLKDYLRRRKALNDYEDWKKDRQIDI